MDKLPELERLSESEKNALITTLWAEVQRLKAQLAALDAKPHEPRKDAHNSSVPPSHSPKRNRPAGPRTGTRRRQCGPGWWGQAAASGTGPSDHRASQNLPTWWWSGAGPRATSPCRV